MTRRALPFLAFLVLAAPAQAAPTLAALKPCYVVDDRTREEVPYSGSGFTPGSVVDILRDGVVERQGVNVDAAGNLPFSSLPAPAIESGQREFTLSAVERGNAVNTATMSSWVAHLAVSVRPKVARPSQKIRLRGLGFTAAKPVYAHYVRRRVLRKTVRLDVPAGPCGTFDVRRAQFPFTPRPGRWTMQIDQSKDYTRSPNTAAVTLGIDVVRVPKKS
jgi:hypothetical protein